MAAQDNNPPKSLGEARERLAEAMEKLVRDSQESRTKNDELRNENDKLKTTQTETQKALDAEKAARQQQTEDEMTFYQRLASIIGKAALVLVAVLGLVWLANNGHLSIKGGQVADTAYPVVDRTAKADLAAVVKKAVEPIENAIATVDKKLVDFDKRIGFTELQQKGLDDRLTKIVQADVARSDKPTASAAGIVSLENWQVLNHTARAKIFQDACQGRVKWSSVNTGLYQAGLVYITKDEAPQIISNCDVGAIVKKAPATTIEANTDTDPNADEDAAAEREQPVQRAVVRGGEDEVVAADAHYNPPSPWGRNHTAPGYGRPGHGRSPAHGGRRTCGPGKRWSEEFQACASGRKTVGMHQYDVPNARCRPGEVRVKEVPIPGGVRRVHQTCR